MPRGFSLIAAACVLLAGQAVAEPTIIETGRYRIDAVPVRGAEPIWDGAKVTVRDSDGDVVARRHAVPAVVDLPPGGGYTVTVVYKESAARAPLTPGKTLVNLKAGEATLELVNGAGGPGRVKPEVWRVYRYRPGAQRGPLVARSRERRPLLTLSEGWYEVEAEYHRGPVTHLIEVDAGRRFDYRIAAPRD